MSDESAKNDLSLIVERFYSGFLRLVAAVCFVYGLKYWAMLIGYSYGGLGRFDLLSAHWRLVAVYMAAFYPVASLGLWTGASWGFVVWVGAAGVEVLMHLVWPYLFGNAALLVTGHFVVLAVYVGFRGVMYYQQRRRSGSVINNLQ